MEHINYTAKNEFRQLAVKNLICNQSYQTCRFYPSTITKIVKNFQPNKVRVIQVSFRDGKYYVIDGKHRVTAISQLFGQDALVPCEIFDGMTYEDEARYAAEQDENKRNVAPDQKIFMMAEAGDDDSKFILRTLKNNNLFIGNTDNINSQKNNYITCAGKLIRIYKSMAKQEFEEYIKILFAAWGGAKRSLDGKVIGGLAKFYNTYKKKFIRKRLVSVLNDTTPDRIIREGNSAVASDRDGQYASVILNIYNKNLKENRLPYKF